MLLRNLDSTVRGLFNVEHGVGAAYPKAEGERWLQILHNGESKGAGHWMPAAYGFPRIETGAVAIYDSLYSMDPSGMRRFLIGIQPHLSPAYSELRRRHFISSSLIATSKATPMTAACTQSLLLWPLSPAKIMVPFSTMKPKCGIISCSAYRQENSLVSSWSEEQSSSRKNPNWELLKFGVFAVALNISGWRDMMTKKWSSAANVRNGSIADVPKFWRTYFWSKIKSLIGFVLNVARLND